MGKDVQTLVFGREMRQLYREKVHHDLDALAVVLDTHEFDTHRPATGLEIELNLVDDEGQPALVNEEVLERLGPEFQTELARFNIELNVDPRPVAQAADADLETTLQSAMDAAQAAARGSGANVMPVGILPTLLPEHLEGDWMSANVRYAALQESTLAERGEGPELDIRGPGGEHLSMYTETIAPASACTSVQLHRQVSPQEFAGFWNAAQCIAGVQVALGANSPFLFGRRLWAETRIPLFQQVMDTRTPELCYQDVRPRAFFGRDWATSIFDLFEENVRCFPALLPELSGEDPVASLAAGETPELHDLRLHNGTVYRWNRPVYDVVGGMPHLRVENRVLPAGPTVLDTVANAAFYFGLVETLSSSGRPLWSQMPHRWAERNFERGARDGIAARLLWPGHSQRLPVTRIVLDELLPAALQGLTHLGLTDASVNRYLSVIEARCRTGRNGATWQTDTVAAHEAAGASRREALGLMARDYLCHVASSQPVHTWPLPDEE